MKLKRLIQRAADTAMPRIDKCVVCGVEKGVTDALCEHCDSDLRELEHGETTAKELSAFSVYNYDGAAGKIVRGYKYNGKQYLADFMAGKMAAAVPNGSSAKKPTASHEGQSSCNRLSSNFINPPFPGRFYTDAWLDPLSFAEKRQHYF